MTTAPPAAPPPDDDSDQTAARAEAAVLGAVLNGAVIDELLPVLPPHDDPDGWTRTAHAAVWQAIVDVHHAGTLPDLVAVVDRLATLRRLDEVGGPAAIVDLQHAAPPSTTAGHWAARVADSAWRRRLTARARKVIVDATNPNADPAGAIVDLDAELDAAPRTDDLPVVTGDLFDQQPDPEWLAHRRIVRGLTVLWGHPSAGKTWVALDLAVHIASGKDWAGEPVRTGRPLHLAGEGGAGLMARYTAALDHHNATPETRRAVAVVDQPIDLTDARDLARLDRSITQHRATVLIVDTWARYALVADENDNAAAGRVIAQLDRLRNRHDLDVIVVHHARKDGDDLRGASALLGALDTSIRVEQDSDGRIVARDRKVKDGPPWRHPLTWRLQPAGRTAVLVPDRDPAADRRKFADALDQLRGATQLVASLTTRWGPEIVAQLKTHGDVTCGTDTSGRPVMTAEGTPRSPL